MLHKTLSNIQSQAINSLTEAQTESALICPVLAALGWNINDSNEVRRQFKTGVGQIDFGLFASENNYVFVEAKRIRKDLSDHEWEVLLYSFEYGAELSVLTNGIDWWFYAPMAGRHWSQRRLHAINLERDPVDKTIEIFRTYLSREAIVGGGTLQTIRNLQLPIPASDTENRKPRKSGRSNFSSIGDTRATSKTQLVKDTLLSDWRDGPYLTWLTGQEGGWQAWIYDNYVASSDTLCLLVKPKPGSRAEFMKLVNISDAELVCKMHHARIYKRVKRGATEG